MDWTTHVPQPPAPPGAPAGATPTSQGWADWIEGQAYVFWQARHPISSAFDDHPPMYDVDLQVVQGADVYVPVDGMTPDEWKSDSSKITGTLELGGQKVKVDITRYKRTYPSIRIQRYQRWDVRLRFKWGSWWKANIGLALYDEYDRTFTFYVKVGDPVTYARKAAYEWRITSKNVNIGIEVKISGDKFKIGGEIDGFIDNPPRREPPEGEPDQFDPSHENPFPDTPHIGPKGMHSESALLDGRRFAEDGQQLVNRLAEHLGGDAGLESIHRALDANPALIASVAIPARRSRLHAIDTPPQWVSSDEVRRAVTEKRPGRGGHEG